MLSLFWYWMIMYIIVNSWLIWEVGAKMKNTFSMINYSTLFPLGQTNLVQWLSFPENGIFPVLQSRPFPRLNNFFFLTTISSYWETSRSLKEPSLKWVSEMLEHNFHRFRHHNCIGKNWFGHDGKWFSWRAVVNVYQFYNFTNSWRRLFFDTPKQLNNFPCWSNFIGLFGVYVLAILCFDGCLIFNILDLYPQFVLRNE